MMCCKVEKVLVFRSVNKACQLCKAVKVYYCITRNRISHTCVYAPISEHFPLLTHLWCNPILDLLQKPLSIYRHIFRSFRKPFRTVDNTTEIKHQRCEPSLLLYTS